MPLNLINAEERLRQPSHIKGVIAGPSGIGKTYLARSLPADETVFLDLEAGTKALGRHWRGTTIDVRAEATRMGISGWEFARNMACFIGGADPSARVDQPYSQAHFEYVCKLFGDVSMLAPFRTVFVDSITVASRLCLNWARGQPEAFSEKRGKPDLLGAYGLLGREMIGWLTQLQHTPDKNVWLVGILDKKLDDYGRVSYQLQIEGSKTGLELPGIVDQVMTLEQFTDDDKQSYRALVCQQPNPWNYPAKDRSGCLDMLEPPDLSVVMHKITTGRRLDDIAQTSIPATLPAQ